MNNLHCDTCMSTQETIVKKLEKTVKIKGKEVTVEVDLRFCSKCKGEVYDNTLHSDLTKKLITKYNELYGFNTNKIQELRAFYNISHQTLAKVLGCAKKTLFEYEKGRSIPNETHMTLIKLVTNDFDKLKELAIINEPKLTNKEKDKIINKKKTLDDIVFPHASEFNGYIDFDEKRFINLIYYFAQKGIIKTKLAKALYLIDFNSYDKYAQSVSGLTYARVTHGPMPDKFTDILEFLINEKLLKKEVIHNNDFTKKIFTSDEKADLSVFSTEELDLFKKVKSFIESHTAGEISELTHEGEIWKNTSSGKWISFDKVNDLKLKL